jgi:hypothetical protein
MESDMPETLKTYRNTKLEVWWQLLNKELARLGLREANFEEVRGYYELGYDPQTAAADLAVVRP